jgi:hypothetical protein
MGLAQNAQNDLGNYLIVLVMTFSYIFFMRPLEMQRRILQYSTISARIIAKDDHDGSTGHPLIIDVGEITAKELLYWAHILSRGMGWLACPSSRMLLQPPWAVEYLGIIDFCV